MNNNCMLPFERYEALPSNQKWMAYATLPAVSWFERECDRLLRLDYVPAPVGAPHSSAEFYSGGAEIEDDTDDDYDPSESDEGSCSDGSSSGSEGSGDEEEQEFDDGVSADELSGLEHDKLQPLPELPQVESDQVSHQVLLEAVQAVPDSRTSVRSPLEPGSWSPMLYQQVVEVQTS
jgi:hypothetical protein